MLMSDIKDEIKSILGRCADSVVYIKTTRAIEILANKGYWNPMQGQMDICSWSDGKTVTLPRDVEVPLAVNTNGAPGFFRNRWFQFHLNGPGTDSCGRGVNCDWNWDDRGDVPCFMDIVSPSYLTVIAQLQNDLDKHIRVFGFDSTGQYIRSQEAEGTWMDGFVPPTNLITDFPQSIIIPDSTRFFKRVFTAGSINTLNSATPHNLTTGAEVLLTLLVAPIPTPLISGQFYFVRVVDPLTVKLYNTRTDALTDQNVIQITSSSGASMVTLEDDRQAFTETKINSATPHKISTGTTIQFTGAPLPVPLVANTNYYAGVIDANDIVIYSTASDASNQINPLYVTTPGAVVVMRPKLLTFPITSFTFSVNHNFLTGDTLVAATTGTLPTPLDTGIDYFARKLDATTITLHNTVADATNGTNPIILTDTGSGTHSLIKTMNATASTGTNNNITAVGHNLNAGSFVSFQTTGSFPTPIAANTVYTAQNPLSANSFSLNDTVPSPVNITALGTGQLKLVISRAFSVSFTSDWSLDASLLATGDIVRVASTGTLPGASPALNTGTDYYLRVIDANTVQLYDTLANANDTVIRTTVSRKRTANVATLTTAANHGFLVNDVVTIDGVQSQKNGVLATIAIAGGGTGHTDGQVGTFTDGAGDQATGTVTVVSGKVTAVTVGAGGAAYINGENVTLSNGVVTMTAKLVVAAGVITGFTILDGGKNFTATQNLTMSGNTAGAGATQTVGTVINTTIQSISVIDGGSGFVVAGGLTASGLSGAGQTLTVGTIANGVTGTPNSYNGVRLTVTAVPTAASFSYASSGVNELATADTGGTVIRSDIQVTGFGTGSLSLDRLISVTAIPLTSNLLLDDASYLTAGVTVRLKTTGTLPAPLAVATDYTLVIQSATEISLLNAGVPVTLTTVGSGTHTLFIAANFGVVPANNYTVTQNEYNNGDAVTALQGTGSTLPSPLVNGTTYYVRRLDNNTIELYDTSANAINTAVTTGRINPATAGIGTNYFTQFLANFLVKQVTRVLKDFSLGFMDLFANDSGRTTALTKIGFYYPDETEPSYRRISVNSCCSWVRIRYRRKTFKILTDNDWIPLNSAMAIVYMVRSFKLYEDNFFEEAKNYELQAEQWLTEEQANNSGPDSAVMQVDGAIWMNSQAQWMQ